MATVALGIVDYGSGNFGSVWNAVQRLGVTAVRLTAPEEMERCSHVIIPGVGAFGAAMAALATRGFRDTLVEEMGRGHRQFLGICVGMQILATAGTEFGSHPGLGLIEGSVDRIAVDPATHPLPHMGWNTVTGADGHPLFAGMDGEPTFYFLHSYHLLVRAPDVLVAMTDYGGPVVAAVSRGCIHGVQFHPEKSQDHGVQLLRNFVALGV